MSSPPRDYDALSSSPVHYSQAGALTPSSNSSAGRRGPPHHPNEDPLSSSSQPRTPAPDHALMDSSGSRYGGGAVSASSSSRLMMVPGSPGAGLATPSSAARGFGRGDMGGSRARWAPVSPATASRSDLPHAGDPDLLTSSSSSSSRNNRMGGGRQRAAARGTPQRRSSRRRHGGGDGGGGDDGDPPSSSDPAGGTGSSRAAGGGPHSDSRSAASDQVVIENHFWGTDVSVDAVRKSFRRFLREFVEDPAAGDEGDEDAAAAADRGGEPLYPRLIWDAVRAQQNSFNLNAQNLRVWDDGRLYRDLVHYPQDIISVMDVVATELMRDMIAADHARIIEEGEEVPPEYLEQAQGFMQVRPFNLAAVHNMRELNPIDIDTLVAIRGMVIRCSSVIPETKEAFFCCCLCQGTVVVKIEEGRIDEPTRCSYCGAQQSMQIIHNRGKYADKQLIRVQETPDSVPEGETPHTLSVFAWDNLVDVVQPGDRVLITGVFRALPTRVNSRKRAVRSLYHTYLDAVHFQRHKSSALQAETMFVDRESEFHTPWDESDELQDTREARERRLIELSQSPNLYERLSQSLAPSIYGLEDVKKGVLCMLFGGANIDAGAKQGRFRGEINVLLCGDPGTSKSQLLQYVHKIAPRGIYTSGKGSSAVGLTAYVTKDVETGEFVLESGALVLSDRGICCIDEFDKMTDSTRSILHEVMEQQTVSIAKAGIVATLNARTSILASANPIESRYNPNLSVVKNIQLGPTLLSRFDLIYLVLDQPSAEHDRRLAQHLVSMYFKDGHLGRTHAGEGGSRTELVPIGLLAQYISYARQRFRPRLTKSARDLLIDQYVQIRRLGRRAGTVAATPRQLESLVRLSEALARMHFRQRVLVGDVQEAVRLMQVATQTTATDEQGRIDMDRLTTGVGAGDRERQQQQLALLRRLLVPGAAAVADDDGHGRGGARRPGAGTGDALVGPKGGEVAITDIVKAMNKDKSPAERIDRNVLLELLTRLSSEDPRLTISRTAVLVKL